MINQLSLKEPHLNDELASLLTRLAQQYKSNRETLLAIGKIYVSIQDGEPSLLYCIDFDFLQQFLK